MKIKIILSVFLIVFGISFIFLGPGGFFKENFLIKKASSAISIENSIKESETDQVLLKSSNIQTAAEDDIKEEITTKKEDASETILSKSKSVFNEIYGILKDMISLIASIFGIFLTKKTIDEKNRNAAKEKRAL